jgi:phosphotransferase system IIB component
MAIEKTINIDVESKDALAGIKSIDSGLTGLDKSAATAGKGVGGISKAFKGLGVAIKAAGIGLVIGALSKLSEIFMQNQKVADGFNTAMEVLSIAFNDFVGFIINNTSGVVKFFKAIFENPKQSLIDFANAFKKNIQERFESYLDTLGFLASAVKKVFSGDFAGALEDVKSAGKESIDVLTGVNNTFDKATEFVGEATEAVKNYATETFKAASENVKLAKSAELAAVINQGLIEKYDRQAEQLRQTRDDESKSIEERIKANEELAKVLDEQEKVMMKNANILVAAAAAELSKNKENIELQKAYQEALNEQAAIEAQITGFRSEQQTNTNSLLKEQKEIQNELALIGKSEREVQKEELKQQYQLQKELIDRQVTDEQQKNELLLTAENDYQTKLKELNADFDAEDLANTEAKAEAELKIEKEVKDAKIANAEAVGGAIGTLAGIAGEGTAAGKALGVASATIDTYVGANKAIAAFPGPAGIAQAVAIIATGLKNVKTILSTKVPKTNVGGISGGGGGGGGAQVQAPSFNIVGASDTNQLADAIGGQTQQPVQAFVVANDVTTAQSLENNIVEGATL